MTTTLPPRAGTDQEPPTARPAVRHRRPGWRDPRILVGVLLVAGSVLAGVRILAAADDTVAVWALDTALPSGTRVGADDVRAVRVRFTSTEQADRYLSASESLPRGSVLGRPVGAGELLPRDALEPQGDPLVEVPLAVSVDDLPATVRQGAVVDVWVTPQAATDATKAATAVRVLDDVVVVAVPAAQDTLAPAGTRQVIVGVEPDVADALGPALGSTASGRVVITRQG